MKAGLLKLELLLMEDLDLVVHLNRNSQSFVGILVDYLPYKIWNCKHQQEFHMRKCTCVASFLPS